MSSNEVAKIFAVIICYCLFYLSAKYSVSMQLIGTRYKYNYSLILVLIFLIVDLLVLNLEIIYSVICISLLIIIAAFVKRFYEYKTSTINYSDLAFLLFQVSLSLRAGLDILASLNYASKGSNKACQIVAEILDQVKKGVDFQSSCERIMLKQKDKKIKQVILQLIITFNSGGSIGKSIEEIALAAIDHQQDDVDREIAKLPIKATFPLLLIFSGALILMLVPPLINLIDFSKGIKVE